VACILTFTFFAYRAIDLGICIKSRNSCKSSSSGLPSDASFRCATRVVGKYELYSKRMRPRVSKPTTTTSGGFLKAMGCLADSPIFLPIHHTFPNHARIRYMPLGINCSFTNRCCCRFRYSWPNVLPHYHHHHQQQHQIQQFQPPTVETTMRPPKHVQQPVAAFRRVGQDLVLKAHLNVWYGRPSNDNSMSNDNRILNESRTDWQSFC
jgi:hypothetical protein